jgi:hypothetical protein
MCRRVDVWFNATVPDDPASRSPGVLGRLSRSRPAWFVAAALAAIILVAVAVLVGNEPDAAEPAGAADPPRFVDAAPTAGIDHVYDGDFEFFVGGGVATFDCDDDGRPDLYFAGGSEPAALYRNDSPVGGALRFVRLESSTTDLTSVTGAYPLDVDNDGLVDLAVLRVGGNVLLRGLGDCDFAPANELLGIPEGDDWTAAFSATWEGSNALPTLAFGSYLVPGDGRLEGDACGASRLVRPDSTGDRYDVPVALEPGHCTLSMLFSDWSRTGQRDLRMTNDRHYYVDGDDQLWRITPGEPPQEYGAADGWRPLQIWGMGIASQDLTGDGYPEVFITSQGDNKLQTLDGGPETPAYRDIALRNGLTLQRPFAGDDVLPSTAWHPEFADVNNDGIIDLLVTKGNVEAQVDFAANDPNNLLIGQPDGTFLEGAESAGILTFDKSRGAALVDLNLDGMLDLVVVNRRAPVAVWRSVGAGDVDQPAAMGRWIAIRLRQPSPNVDAVGAWIEVRVGDRVVTREVTVGGGHASGQMGWQHAGLGTADDAAVRVTWPDGEIGPWIEVDADQFVTIERGAPTAVQWTPDP